MNKIFLVGSAAVGRAELLVALQQHTFGMPIVVVTEKLENVSNEELLKAIRILQSEPDVVPWESDLKEAILKLNEMYLPEADKQIEKQIKSPKPFYWKFVQKRKR